MVKYFSTCCLRTESWVKVLTLSSCPRPECFVTFWWFLQDPICSSNLTHYEVFERTFLLSRVFSSHFFNFFGISSKVILAYLFSFSPQYLSLLLICIQTSFLSRKRPDFRNVLILSSLWVSFCIRNTTLLLIYLCILITDTYLSRSVSLAFSFKWRVCEDVVNVLYRVDTDGTHAPKNRDTEVSDSLQTHLKKQETAGRSNRF